MKNNSIHKNYEQKYQSRTQNNSDFEGRKLLGICKHEIVCVAVWGAVIAALFFIGYTGVVYAIP
jgi:hypothetical protein